MRWPTNARTLYLVDGSGYIFRAFFALPQLNNSRGMPTNAVYGFVRMLLKLLKDARPRHIAVVFDSPKKTFRDDLFRVLQGQPRRDAQRSDRADPLHPSRGRRLSHQEPGNRGFRGRRRDRHPGGARRAQALHHRDRHRRQGLHAIGRTPRDVVGHDARPADRRARGAGAARRRTSRGGRRDGADGRCDRQRQRRPR